MSFPPGIERPKMFCKVIVILCAVIFQDSRGRVFNKVGVFTTQPNPGIKDDQLKECLKKSNTEDGAGEFGCDFFQCLKDRGNTCPSRYRWHAAYSLQLCLEYKHHINKFELQAQGAIRALKLCISRKMTGLFSNSSSPMCQEFKQYALRSSESCVIQYFCGIISSPKDLNTFYKLIKEKYFGSSREGRGANVVIGKFIQLADVSGCSVKIKSNLATFRRERLLTL